MNEELKRNDLTLEEFKKYYKVGDRVEYAIEIENDLPDVVEVNGKIMSVQMKDTLSSGMIDSFEDEYIYVPFFLDNLEKLHYSSVELSDEVKATLNREKTLIKLLENN